MRALAAAAVFAALAAWGGGRAAQATEVGYARRYGLGVMAGDPTGLSGKMWLGPTNAIAIGVGGYGYGYRRGCFRDGAGRMICDRGWGERVFSLHADYLWQSKIVQGAAAQLDWHIGAGGRALFMSAPCAYDCWQIGLHGPVGLDLTFNRPSFLEVFFELAAAVYFLPGPFAGLEGALGVRAYF
jgi:hypothetical protein